MERSDKSEFQDIKQEAAAVEEHSGGFWRCCRNGENTAKPYGKRTGIKNKALLVDSTG